jgi:S-adenosylmethionine hydrolase
VVDPGVGTTRRPIAAQIGDQYYVGPDNGIFTPLMELAETKGQEIKVIHLDNPKYWLPEVTNTFHGRDIFSPVAAHLAAGVPLEKMGKQIKDPVRLVMPQPVRTERGWRGQVVLIDAFGNIATNLSGDLIKKKPNVMIHIGGERIQGLVKSYGERTPGEVVALVDSENFLEVAVVNGSGAQTIQAVIGDPVELVYL